MTSKEEIEQLAEQDFNNRQECGHYELADLKSRDYYYDGFTNGYTQCQEDTKQILLDFIKWSNAVDEYGNKLDEIDIDNFLNKKD